MKKIRRFESLICWQKARGLSNKVYDLSNCSNFIHDPRLRNQIQSASSSVMHNIAEGSDAGSDPEFIRFLKMARRSCSEVQSELYLALDRKYISESERETAYELADETKRLINGLIAFLRKVNSSSFSNRQLREASGFYSNQKDGFEEDPSDDPQETAASQ